MEEEESTHDFDRYLANEMPTEERAIFEQKLSNSNEFRIAFESYSSFSDEIIEGFEYQAIQRQLKSIHSSLFHQKKSFLLRPIFLIPSGIAAGILLLISLNIGSFSNKSDKTYADLANGNAENNATEERSTDDENNTYGYGDSNLTFLSDESIELIESLPKGTAFQLSASGYFITAKHVVADASRIILQQRKNGLTFEVSVVYLDSLLDFALLQCSPSRANTLHEIPYTAASYPQELGVEVFTLGFPKSDIVYTKGVISSESGYQSDTNYYEISLPSNPGQSGAPLFNGYGEFIGIITGKRTDQEAVTYVLRPSRMIEEINLVADTISRDILRPKPTEYDRTIDRIKIYIEFIFEVHNTN